MIIYRPTLMEQDPNIVLVFFFFDSLLTTVVGNWHHIISEEGFGICAEVDTSNTNRFIQTTM